MARKTLNAQIEAKAVALRAKQDEKSSAASALITASENAAKESAEAARQARAAEQALSILDAAGVTL